MSSRIGDHIWWISDLREFYYPCWNLTYGTQDIFGRNCQPKCLSMDLTMLRECISILHAILRIGQVTLERLLQQRIFRFFIGGGVALTFNILLISIMIELVGFNTPVLRNVANALSTELSLLFSFFIYRTWVWPGSNATVQEVVWRQIPLFHLSAGTAVSIRILIVFPILDWLGIHYVINVITGVLLGASINYVLSARFVFSHRVKL